MSRFLTQTELIHRRKEFGLKTIKEAKALAPDDTKLIQRGKYYTHMYLYSVERLEQMRMEKELTTSTDE